MLICSLLCLLLCLLRFPYFAILVCQMPLYLTTGVSCHRFPLYPFQFITGQQLALATRFIHGSCNYPPFVVVCCTVHRLQVLSCVGICVSVFGIEKIMLCYTRAAYQCYAILNLSFILCIILYSLHQVNLVRRFTFGFCIMQSILLSLSFPPLLHLEFRIVNQFSIFIYNAVRFDLNIIDNWQGYVYTGHSFNFLSIYAKTIL